MATNGHKNGHSNNGDDSARQRDLIFDWNVGVPPHPFVAHAFELNDESLRDGVQSPSVIDPPVEAKLEIVDLMESLGIHRADIGLPGAGKRAYDAVTRLATHIRDRKMRIKPNCAARTVVADIAPVAEVQQKVGIPISSTPSSAARRFASSRRIGTLITCCRPAARPSTSA